MELSPIAVVCDQLGYWIQHGTAAVVVRIGAGGGHF
jgi:hypothetical protein